MTNKYRLCVLLLMAIILPACSAIEFTTSTVTKPPSDFRQKIMGKSLEPVDFRDLEGWDRDQHKAALEAFNISCRRINTLPEEREMLKDSPFKDYYKSVGDWRRVCREIRDAGQTNDTAKQYFEREFHALLGQSRQRYNGSIHRYYETQLLGSYQKSVKYNVPVYKMPEDRFLDLTRAEIEAGALAGKNLELLYLHDAVDVFALHVQGSALVKLDNGQTIRIGYAGKNRHPYKSIGKTFEEWNLLPRDQINMPNMEKYLRDNPEQAGKIFNTNPSFIFFRVVTGDGPIGAQGVALTPLRSLAVDRTIFPLGMPFWIDINHPEGYMPLRRLMVAQDTGTAIKGVVRGDFFWGSGDDAKRLAGLMRSYGRYYVLLPR